MGRIRKINTFLEVMEEEEATFIEKKYRSESKIFMKTINILLIIAAFSPLVMCIRLIYIEENPQIQKLIKIYLIGLTFMVTFVGLIALLAYRLKVWGLYKDSKKKCKMIEKTHITEKKYMPQNDSYYFYLDSPTKLSIEVSQDDYRKLDIGDEINIEFGRYSKEYFGYY